MRRERLAAAVVGVATLALAARLLALVDAHAVDLLYWDQLDLYEALKGDVGPWERFRWQHGPHRQGLPFVAARWIADATAWNTRVEAFGVAAWVIAATGLALWLRRRLLGPLAASDVAIPLLLLTPAQYGIFVHTPNASHGAAPLCLLVLFCLALTLKGRVRRVAALVAIDFAMVHTGFALFAGALTPLVLALDALQQWRAGGPRAAAPALGGAALALAWIGLFLVGYTGRHGTDDVVLGPAALYPAYVAYMFSNLLGIKGGGPASLAAGAVAALAVLAVALRELVRLARARAPADPASFAIATLALFSLLFCTTTAVGRLPFGLSGSQSTRYVPLVAPGLLALYLAAMRLRRPRARAAAGAFAALAMLAATFPMREPEARFLHHLSQGKRAWIEAYLATGDVAAADRAAGLRVYPRYDPADRIDEKLAYLCRQRLSFFAHREPRACPPAGR